MGLILFVVAGAFVGWLAAAVEEVDEGVLARMGVGILGALLGGFLLAIVGGSTALTNVTLLGAVVGCISATILVGLVNFSTGYKHHGPDAT